MKRIIGHRQCGKTKVAIELATTENIPILVKDKATAKMVEERQKIQGDHHPKPLTVYDILAKDFRGVPSVIVDDAEFVLQALLHHHNVGFVRAVAMTDIDLPSDIIPQMHFTVNDFIGKIDDCQHIIIVDGHPDNQLWATNEGTAKSIPNDLLRSWITSIKFDDTGYIVINIGKPY